MAEVYPDVFAMQRGGAASRYAGMAMQQPGDFVTPLSPEAREWFRVRGLQKVASWVSTVAGIGDQFWFKQHGRKSVSIFVPPVGPMGPAVPARHRLPC